MKYKVTGWTYCNLKYLNKYKDTPNEKFLKFRETVIDELRNKGYKFSGSLHQSPYIKCVPIINKKYVFFVSMRTWGGIMAEALGHTGEMDYCEWAWDNPEPEVLPCK